MTLSGTRRIALASSVLLLALAPALEAAAQVRGGGRTSINRAPPSHARAAPANRGGNVNRGDANRGGNANRNVNRNTDVNRNRNVNRDVNVNRDIDIDVDHHYDWDDHYHPIATGVAIGTAAAVTSAVVGSMIYSLPPACSPYAGGYYACNGVYYEPRYQGDTVVYVVVDQP